VSLAALDLRGDLKCGSGGLRLDPGILCFHLNSRVLTFYLNVTFLCKLRRIRVLGAQWK